MNKTKTNKIKWLDGLYAEMNSAYSRWTQTSGIDISQLAKYIKDNSTVKKIDIKAKDKHNVKIIMYIREQMINIKDK